MATGASEYVRLYWEEDLLTALVADFARVRLFFSTGKARWLSSKCCWNIQWWGRGMLRAGR